MIKNYKWLCGFIIFWASLMLLNHFIGYAIEGLHFAIIATMCYLIALGIYIGKKWVVRGVIIITLLIAGIHVLDGAMESLFRDEIILRNDMIAATNEKQPSEEANVNQTEAEGTSELQASRGYSFYLMVHELKVKVDVQHASDFIKWLSNRQGLAFDGDNEAYERIFFLAISVVLALFLILIIRFKYSRIFLLVPFIAFVYMWYQYIDIPRIIYSLYFIGVFAFFVLDGQSFLKWKASSYDVFHYSEKGLFRYAVILGLIVVVVSIIATTVFPLDSFNRLTDPLVPNFWGGRTGYTSEGIKMYTLNDTPYQANANALGGPILGIDRNTILFKVKMDYKQDTPVYLKGNVKDFYDGYRWLSRANTYKKQYEFYKGNKENLALLHSESFDDLGGTIRLEEMKTVTLFTPMGLYESSLGDKVYVSLDNEAFFKAGAFVQFLGEYKFKATGKDFLLSDEIDYLQLPDNIDEETYQLARDLAAIAQTESDKMVIMTNFLLSNFEYTLYPPMYQKDREFVSKFLFDTKEGYCTYYATALTVMARMNGIPARYVEGFRIDPGSEDGEGFTKVTEGDAHAWCEVYLKDRGWVIFESTPPYAVAELTLDDETTQMIGAVMNSEETGQSAALSEEANTFKEGLLEESMLMGDDGGDSGRVREETAQAEPVDAVWIIQNLLMIVAGLAGVILVSMGVYNRAIIRPNGTRSRALKMTYYLTYLLTKQHPERPAILDYLLGSTTASQDDQTQLLKFLYHGASKGQDSDVREVSDLIYRLIHEQEQAFKQSFGIISYLSLKLFKVRKIIR